MVNRFIWEMIEEVNNIYVNMKLINFLRLGVYYGFIIWIGVVYFIKFFYCLYISQNRDDGVWSDGVSINYGNIMNYEEF